MSAQIAERIIQILKSQIELQEETNKSLTLLNCAIKDRQTELIMSTIHKQDILTEKMATLEKERLQLIQTIEDIDNPQIPLTSVLRYLPDKYHKKLLALREKLKKQLAENSTINVSNEILLKEGLVDFKKGVEIIASTQKKPAGYGYKGKSTDFQKNIINKKI